MMFAVTDAQPELERSECAAAKRSFLWAEPPRHTVHPSVRGRAFVLIVVLWWWDASLLTTAADDVSAAETQVAD